MTTVHTPTQQHTTENRIPMHLLSNDHLSVALDDVVCE